MSKQIDITNIAYGFRIALIETFEQVHGMYLNKGTSMFETLAEVTAEQASQPMGNCATIAAHVEHTRYYLQVLEDTLLDNDLSYVNWQTTWETVSTVSDDEWEAIKTNLKITYESVKGQLDNADSWDGDKELSSMLSIIIHSAHHLGEIRQMLCHLEP